MSVTCAHLSSVRSGCGRRAPVTAYKRGTNSSYAFPDLSSRSTSIQNLCNTRVIHHSQCLPLGIESSYDALGVHADLDHFQFQVAKSEFQTRWPFSRPPRGAVPHK